MDIGIDVFESTRLAPVWHIQWHTFRPYIMGIIYVPWFSPHPPQLAIKEHTNGVWHDVGDDDVGDTAKMDVTIAFNNKSKPLLPPPMSGTHPLQWL